MRTLVRQWSWGSGSRMTQPTASPTEWWGKKGTGQGWGNEAGGWVPIKCVSLLKSQPLAALRQGLPQKDLWDRDKNNNLRDSDIHSTNCLRGLRDNKSRKLKQKMLTASRMICENSKIVLRNPRITFGVVNAAAPGKRKFTVVVSYVQNLRNWHCLPGVPLGREIRVSPMWAQKVKELAPSNTGKGGGGGESHLHCAPVISVLTIPALAWFFFFFHCLSWAFCF